MRVYQKDYPVSVYKYRTDNRKAKVHYLIVLDELTIPTGKFAFLVKDIKDWLPSSTTQDNLDKNYVEMGYSKLSKEMKLKVCMCLHQMHREEPLYQFDKNNDRDVIEQFSD